MSFLTRWYHPTVVRVALLAVSVAISLAAGHGIALAGDDAGGG